MTAVMMRAQSAPAKYPVLACKSGVFKVQGARKISHHNNIIAGS